MVQTPDQYQFIYAAVVEQLLYGDTEFEADELDNLMEENLIVLPGGVNGFSHQVSYTVNMQILLFRMQMYAFSLFTMQ